VVWWWPEDPGLGQTANNGVRLASNNPRTPDQKIKPIPTLYKPQNKAIIQFDALSMGTGTVIQLTYQ